MIQTHTDHLMSIAKSTIIALYTAIINFFVPVSNFLWVIAGLATVNMIAGWMADKYDWSFKKAFRAIIYLIGYVTLLLLSFAVGIFMNQNLDHVTGFSSWVTWIMVYFYSVNILRNWKIIQPDNRVVNFMYWVATVKFIEKIKYLSDYQKEKDINSNTQNDEKKKTT